MRKIAFLAIGLLALGLPAAATVGQKLPDVAISSKGMLLPRTGVDHGRMVMDGKDIGYGPWSLKASDGRIRIIHHLACRMGVEDTNKVFIDLITSGILPDRLPDSPCKIVTVLNLADALWGTRGMAIGKFEASQRKFPSSIYIADEQGLARQAWGLQPGTSAFIILDKDGTVLFQKEGRMSGEEVAQATAILKAKLKLP